MAKGACHHNHVSQVCVLTSAEPNRKGSAEPRLRTTAVDKAVWHTLIIVWFGGLRLFLSASLHWNALKPHSHVGSRVLSRRNGHENFHSPTLWSADSGMLTLRDGAMSPKCGCQNYCTLCWRWLLVGCKKFLLFFPFTKNGVRKQYERWNSGCLNHFVPCL